MKNSFRCGFGFGRIQHFAYFLDELHGRERLSDARNLASERWRQVILPCGIRREKKHRDLGLHFGSPLHNLKAVHAWHNEIDMQEVNFNRWPILEKLYSFRATYGSKGCVSVPRKHCVSEADDQSLII